MSEIKVVPCPAQCCLTRWTFAINGVAEDSCWDTKAEAESAALAKKAELEQANESSFNWDTKRDGWICCRKDNPCLKHLLTPVPEGCQYNNRFTVACSKGTKGCQQYHAPAASLPVQTRPPAGVYCPLSCYEGLHPGQLCVKPPVAAPVEQAAPLRPLFSEWIQNPPFCCLRCGYQPIEDMKEYLLIHGEDAKCIRCNERLVGQTDPYPEREPQRSEVKPNEAQSQKSAAIEQARPAISSVTITASKGAASGCNPIGTPIPIAYSEQARPQTPQTDCSCGHSGESHKYGFLSRPCSKCTCGNYRPEREPAPTPSRAEVMNQDFDSYCDLCGAGHHCKRRRDDTHWQWCEGDPSPSCWEGDKAAEEGQFVLTSAVAEVTCEDCKSHLEITKNLREVGG